MAAEPDIATIAAELTTVRDFLRHAVSEFRANRLVHGHGTTSAFDDAVFLILETLSLPVDQLEPYLDARLLESERRRLAERIRERVTTRKPTAYIVKRAYIQGVPFRVDERVIVPRSFIGELLFGPHFSEEDGLFADQIDSVSAVLDLCTGSGCLAILAAMRFPDAEVDAVELSADAAEVARLNFDESGYEDRLTLFTGDLYAPLEGRRYDLIITNPPYVDAEAMAALPPEYRHEPAMALAAGDDGLDLVHRILKGAVDHLTEDGGIICEVGSNGHRLMQAYPTLPFLWLDTQESDGEVFYLTRAALAEALGS
jgi:ribosomal protein L3 glutamine methyltransferase